MTVGWRSEAFGVLPWVGVLLLARILEPSPEQVVLFGWAVPPLCTFRLIFGRSCWGCGLTRSFSFLAHGDFAQAFALNPLGPPLFLGLLVYVTLRLVRLGRAAFHRSPSSVALLPSQED